MCLDANERTNKQASDKTNKQTKKKTRAQKCCKLMLNLSSIAQIPLDEHHTTIIAYQQHHHHRTEIFHTITTRQAQNAVDNVTANHQNAAVVALRRFAVAHNKSCKYIKTKQNKLNAIAYSCCSFLILFPVDSPRILDFCLCSARQITQCKVYANIMPKHFRPLSLYSCRPTFSVYWNELFKSFPLSQCISTRIISIYSGNY